jgi:hypothetical protein
MANAACRDPRAPANVVAGATITIMPASSEEEKAEKGLEGPYAR